MKRVVRKKKDVSLCTSEATKSRKTSLAFEESRYTRERERKKKGAEDKAEHEVRWSSKFREVLQIVGWNVQRRRKRNSSLMFRENCNNPLRARKRSHTYNIPMKYKLNKQYCSMERKLFNELLTIKLL